MKDQLKTIRDALEGALSDDQPYIEKCKQALAALDQLEAMAGEQQQYPLPDGLYPGSKDWAAGTYADRVAWLHTMYEGQKALVAEYEQALTQPQAEHDLKDVRCECCGYMTYHREHMGCIRAASKQPQAETEMRPADKHDMAVYRAAERTVMSTTVRACGNVDCGWSGTTDRYLGAIGPLCPECGETTEPVKQQAEAVPPGYVTDKSFRWDGEKQQHIPRLIVEFEPVPVNSPCNAKGWQDRDRAASMFDAAIAQQKGSV